MGLHNVMVGAHCDGRAAGLILLSDSIVNVDNRNRLISSPLLSNCYILLPSSLAASNAAHRSSTTTSPPEYIL